MPTTANIDIADWRMAAIKGRGFGLCRRSSTRGALSISTRGRKLPQLLEIQPPPLNFVGPAPNFFQGIFKRVSAADEWRQHIEMVLTCNIEHCQRVQRVSYNPGVEPYQVIRPVHWLNEFFFKQMYGCEVRVQSLGYGMLQVFSISSGPKTNLNQLSNGV